MANDMGLPALGGGAGVGEAIARLLAQRLAAARFAEEQKQNTEQNTYRNRALDLTEKTRGDTLAEQSRQHDLQSRHATISARSLLPPGADISEADQSGYAKAGVGGPGLSKPNQTLSSVSLSGLSPLQGASGMAVSRETAEAPQRRPGYTASPTFDQTIKLADLSTKQQTAGNAIDQKWQALENQAVAAESRGRLAEANALRAEAQAHLVEAKAAGEGAKGKGTADAAKQERARVNALAKELRDDPSLGQAVGPVQGRLPSLRGKSIDFDNRIARLKSMLSLEGRQGLKGQGAVSNYESQMLEKAMTSIDQRVDEPTFKAELQRIIDATGDGAATKPAVQEFDYVNGKLVPRGK